MSSKLLTLANAQDVLHRNISDTTILKHCLATQKKAVQLGQLVSWKLNLDFSLIEIGALLHDIGRARTHDITHGFVGGKILEKENFPSAIVKIVERHVLGGFTAEEAFRVGLPKRSFLPKSWEEQIVSVADKLGHYEWEGIVSPNQWLSKLQERFNVLRGRYGGGEPYETSMQRAENYAIRLAQLALQGKSLSKR
jgi:uncharacterized protein